MSRLLNENTECRLAPFVFHEIVNLFKATPEIDLFASALNHQVPKYISWNPDQEAFAIDAFSVSWANIKFYAFPPFSLIGGLHIENQERRCVWDHNHPLVEHTVLVPNDGLTSPGFPCNFSTKHPSITIQSRSATSTLIENGTASSSFISTSLRHPNIPPEITDVIQESWRPTTRSRYESVLRT